MLCQFTASLGGKHTILGNIKILCQIYGSTIFQMGDLYLTPNKHFFLAISWREQVTFRWYDDDDDFQFFTINKFSWIFIMLTQWKTVIGQTWRSTRTHYTDFDPTSVCSYSLKLLLSRVATHTNFIIFGLIRLGLDPTMYRNRGKPFNHYTADMISIFSCLSKAMTWISIRK
jgi:hypothetical protein